MAHRIARILAVLAGAAAGDTRAYRVLLTPARVEVHSQVEEFHLRRLRLLLERARAQARAANPAITVLCGIFHWLQVQGY